MSRRGAGEGRAARARIAWAVGLPALVCACGSGSSSASPGAAKDAATDVAGDALVAPDATRDASASPAGDAGEIAGTVIDAVQGIPLAGRSVFVGSLHAKTDGSGRFAIAGAPDVYDLVVVEPDRSVASVYLGLSRRDPLVLHHGSPVDTPLPAQMATISGTLSGGPSWPLGPGDGAGLWFLSSIAKSHEALGGQLPSLPGPSYGPLRVLWDGTSTLTGQLYAWASFAVAADAGATNSFYVANQSITLADGGAQAVNLSLSAVSQTARVTGTVQSGATTPPTQKLVYFGLPGLPGARIPLADDDSATSDFDYEVPSLALPGASLCVEAVSASANATAPILTGSVCGVTPGAPATPVLQMPPSLAAPATITGATKLAWTPFAGGVYELDFVFGPTPTAATPNVYLYTGETSATWPDLAIAGVPFPAGESYECTVVGLGVFASIDAATGSSGIAAAIVAEFRRSNFPAKSVTLSQ